MREPISHSEITIAKDVYDRVNALLALPDFALSSDDKDVYRQAHALDARFYDHQCIGRCTFDDGTIVVLALMSDNKSYWLDYGVTSISQPTYHNEVCMLVPDEYLIFNRWRYHVHINIK